jgi:RNA polymerase sigma-70 factor (ECF subfamily)
MEIADIEARDRAGMAKLVDGHDAALNDLMDRHDTAVFHFLCRMLGNEDDARDLAQETFVRVFRARDRYRPDQKFSTWLFTIAANLARNRLRWRSRHPNVSLNSESEATDSTLGDALPSNNPAPDEIAVAAERAKAVRAAVQDLPADMREAIALCEWEDLAIAEAAAILRCTPKAVESRLYRARQLLREKLKCWL